jgi:predicted transcriptional regulator
VQEKFDVVPITAAPATRAAFVTEEGVAFYEPVVGWAPERYESGELVYHPIIYDVEYPVEAIPLDEHSEYFVKILFSGDKLTEDEIADHAKRVREKMERASILREQARMARRKIVTALLDAGSTGLSKDELISQGAANSSEILTPLLGFLKASALVQESVAGTFTLTEKGLKAAQKAKAMEHNG